MEVRKSREADTAGKTGKRTGGSRGIRSVNRWMCASQQKRWKDLNKTQRIGVLSIQEDALMLKGLPGWNTAGYSINSIDCGKN